VNDAKLLRSALNADECGFAPEHCLLLADDEVKERQPTFGNCSAAMESFLKRPAAEDLLLVFFAGHARESDGEVLLSPADATLPTLKSTGIPLRELRSKMAASPANRKLLILDACHSGAGRDLVAMSRGFLASLEASDGVCVLASCGRDQISHEWKEKGCGVFTHYFIEALRRGAPHDMDGNVTAGSVFEWAKRRVIEWARENHTVQEPVSFSQGGDEIVVAKRELHPEKFVEADGIPNGGNTATKQGEADELARGERELVELKEQMAVQCARLEVWWMDGEKFCGVSLLGALALVFVISSIKVAFDIGMGFCVPVVITTWVCLCFYLFGYKKPKMKNELCATERRVRRVGAAMQKRRRFLRKSTRADAGIEGDQADG
jgi:hypothetical protein